MPALRTLTRPAAAPAALAFAVALALALALAACGSGGSSAGAGTSAAGTSAGTSAGAAGSASAGAPSSGSDTAATTVTATEADFTIALSQPQVSAGTYTFSVVNSGKATHSLTIKGPGGVDMTSDTVQGGQSTTMTVTLQPGTYDVYCPIGNHRAMGMDTTLTVS